MARTSPSINRLHACKNPYQGKYKRVLCVCSAGLLRSPTTALVLSQEPFNYNTRACGLHDYALVEIDDVLVNWADEIVVMEQYMLKGLPESANGKPLICLDIKDQFEYRSAELIELIKTRYLESQ